MARSLAEQTDSLAAYLPTGRVWASKRIEGTVTRGLLAGLSGELIRNAALVEEFRQEILPDQTTLFLDEWERALGIPDDCFTGAGSDDERRNDILAKLSSLGVQTAEDMRRLALQVYGVELTITTPQRDETAVFPYTFNPTGDPDPTGDGGSFRFGLSERELRFQIVITYQNLPKAVRFPLTFPIPFLTREVAVIECLFEKLRPANVGFTQQIPIPTESPVPAPEPPGFQLQTMSLDFDNTYAMFVPSGSALSAGVTSTFTIALWAKNLASPAVGTDYLFRIGNAVNASNSIDLAMVNASNTDMNVIITNASISVRQNRRYNGVADGNWHHYVFSWNGLVGGLLFYVDGVLTPPTTTTSNLDGTGMSDPSRQVFVGGLSANRFIGPMYSVAIYDQVLSATQIAAMYNGGNARDINLLAIEGPISVLPIHYYRLGLGTTDGEFGTDHGTVGNLPLSGTPSAADATDLSSDIPL